MAVDKDRRHYVSLPNVLTLLMMAGGLSGVWVANAVDNEQTKGRVTALEQEQKSTRELIQETGKEIKADVKATQETTNMILQELRAMQAVERERERARRSRDGS